MLCFNKEDQTLGITCSHFAAFKNFKVRHKKLEDSADEVDITSLISHRLDILTSKFDEYVNSNKLNVASFVKLSFTVPTWQIPQGGLVCSINVFFHIFFFSVSIRALFRVKVCS